MSVDPWVAIVLGAGFVAAAAGVTFAVAVRRDIAPGEAAQ